MISLLIWVLINTIINNGIDKLHQIWSPGFKKSTEVSLYVPGFWSLYLDTTCSRILRANNCMKQALTRYMLPDHHQWEIWPHVRLTIGSFVASLTHIFHLYVSATCSRNSPYQLKFGGTYGQIENYWISLSTPISHQSSDFKVIALLAQLQWHLNISYFHLPWIKTSCQKS